MGLFDRQARGSTSVAAELTASAARVPANAAEKQGYRRLIQAWQQTALGCYETYGECWYPSQFYGRALSRIRLFVAEVQPDGEKTPIEGNAKADEILGRVQDPGGGRSNMLRTFGQLRFVTGESFLIVTEEDDDEEWEMVSVNELRIGAGGGYVRFRAPGLPPEQLLDAPDDAFEPLPGTAVVYRFWQRSPNFSALADAPTRGVLTLYDLLGRLTAAEIASSKSRAAQAGILFLANEIKFAGPGVQDDDPRQDKFMADLTAAMTAAIRDPGEASAAVPMIARIPAELIGGADGKKGFEHLRLNDVNDISQSELITSTIRRIAIGLDIPPEILLGLEDTNHWNAWMIQDETWQSHLGPAAQGFCDDLTTSYFRPACKAAGIANWQNLVVMYDAAEVINHPDRTADAKDAHDKLVLSDKAYLEAVGFNPENDMPDEEEKLRRIGVKIGDASLAAYGVPGLRRGTEIEQSPTDVTVPADQAQTTPGAVKRGPPETPTAAETQGPPAADPLAASIVAMADMAVERCRELAGSRLRTQSRGCESCVEKLRDVPQNLVASVLGFDAATELGAEAPSALVAGGAKSFSRAAVKRGMTEEWADRLAALVEMHAARTLFQTDAPALPSGFLEAARRAT